MHAVLRVDLQPRRVLFHTNNLIHAGRAITLRRLVIEREIDLDRHRRILQRQMAGLVFLVVGVRQEHAGQPVKADHTIRLGIDDFRRLILAAHMGVVGAELEGEGQLIAQILHPHHHAAHGGAHRGAEFLHRRQHVANHLQFFVHPALLVGGVIGLQFVPTTLGGDGGHGAFGGHHAGLHRGVTALDARHVQEAGGATDQGTAREGQLRHRLPAAIVDGARAIGNAPTAFQDLADRRVGFPALELLERRQVRVVIVEPH